MYIEVQRVRPSDLKETTCPSYRGENPESCVFTFN